MQLPVAAALAQIGPAAPVTHALNATGPAAVFFGNDTRITQATVTHKITLEIVDALIVLQIINITTTF
jgi:hypothetical protein